MERPEPEGIIPFRAACTKLNCTDVYLRRELFKAGFPIVEFSPRKRGLLESHYMQLLHSRMKPALDEPTHV